MKFKVGDKVRAIDNYYPYTNKRNGWEGIVTETNPYTFSATTTKCTDARIIGDNFVALNERNFELVEQKENLKGETKMKTEKNDTIDRELVATLLMDYKTTHRMTNEEIAKMSFVGRSTIDRILRKANVTGASIMAVIHALNLPYEEELEKKKQKEQKEKEKSFQMSLNEIAKMCWEIAESHGWHDEPRTRAEIIALCHGELSEALEEVRKGSQNHYYRNDGKPEGYFAEMIDCVIRILEHLWGEGCNIERVLFEKCYFNKKRGYRHGGKKL